MSLLQMFFLLYLVAINLIAFLTYGIDKRKAKKEQWRISETALLFLTAIGGAFGAILGMHCFHHKTKKTKFKFVVPVCCVAWLLILLSIFHII